jgi:hypothetical protein
MIGNENGFAQYVLKGMGHGPPNGAVIDGAVPAIPFDIIKYGSVATQDP